MLCITKLKALLIKLICFFKSTHYMKIWLLFNIAVLKICGKFQEKHPWLNWYPISANKCPQCLLDFKTCYILKLSLFEEIEYSAYLPTWRFANTLNMNSVINVFLGIFWKCSKQLFQRTQMVRCFSFREIVPQKFLEQFLTL